MIDMTTEEKARAYDEALKDMRAIYPNLKGDAKLAVEHAFPELRESEDERIRKSIIQTLEFACAHKLVDYDAVVKMKAWLEKQKENADSFTDEDENASKYLHELISFGYIKKFFDAQTAADMREWLNTRLKSLRPSWKPSEEQMRALQNAVALTACDKELARLYNQLKKLI